MWYPNCVMKLQYDWVLVPSSPLKHKLGLAFMKRTERNSYCPQGCRALLHHTAISSLTKSLCSKCLWSVEQHAQEQWFDWGNVQTHTATYWATEELCAWLSGYILDIELGLMPHHDDNWWDNCLLNRKYKLKCPVHLMKVKKNDAHCRS